MKRHLAVFFYEENNRPARILELVGLKLDPFDELRQDLLTFTQCYTFSHNDRIHDKAVGPLITIPGLPENIEAVDGWRSGLQSTSLAIDLSGYRDNRFVWHLDSDSPSAYKKRRLLVDEEDVRGAEEYRWKKDGSGSWVALKPDQLLAFGGIVKSLATQATQLRKTQLPISWPR